jgi:uncharacterized protein YbcI
MLMPAGELNASIARAVVRACKSTLGRGPTRAQAFFRQNIVVVVLEETQTEAERALVSSGRSDAVMDMRSQLQRTMEGQLRSIVEERTGRNVTAMLSSSHINPDVAAEVFILDGPVETAPA